MRRSVKCQQLNTCGLTVARHKADNHACMIRQRDSLSLVLVAVPQLSFLPLVSFLIIPN